MNNDNTNTNNNELIDTNLDLDFTWLQEFEKLDKVVREKTSILRREKDDLNLKLTPLVNQHKFLSSKV